MAELPDKITIDIVAGPVLRTAMDVLEFADEILDGIPDYVPEKRELEKRRNALAEICIDMLQKQKGLTP